MGDCERRLGLSVAVDHDCPGRFSSLTLMRAICAALLSPPPCPSATPLWLSPRIDWSVRPSPRQPPPPLPPLFLSLCRAAAEEQRRLMLSQLLLPAASERLSRVRLVKPAKARQVEDAVLGAARAGRVTGPLDEAALKELLAQFAAVNERKPSITVRAMGEEG